MAFLVALLAEAIPAVAELGLVGQGIIGIGLSLGVSYIAKALQPKSTTSATATQGMQLSLSYNPNGPRLVPIGKCASAGALAYHNTFGPNGNDYVEIVYRLGDLPCGNLLGAFANGVALTLGDFEDTGTVTGFPVAEYPGAMWIRYFNGDWDQDADPDLVAHGASVGFTDKYRGRGVCYARVTMKFDPKLYTTGLPGFVFVFQGAKLYDWRKDSTVGGSGSHRWGDESTYETTRNGKVVAYNWYRGVTVNGSPLAGMNVPPEFLPYDLWTAAGNADDETVGLKSTLTQTRYFVDGIIGTDADNTTVVRDLMTSTAATMVDAGGIFKPYAGVSQSPVMSITDADFMGLDEVTYVPKKSRATLINSVFGSFNDPAQMYQSTALPPRISTDDIAADGGLQLSANYSLTYVSVEQQGQRVMEIFRRQARFQRSASGTLRPGCMALEAGDWLSWTSARFGFSELLFRVVQGSPDRDAHNAVELAETADSIFSWDPQVDELDPLNPSTVGEGGSSLSSVMGIALAAILLEGNDGEQTPGLRLTWTPIEDQTVTSLVLEFRQVGGTLVIQKVIADPSEGSYEWVEGVQGGLRYETRLAMVTAPARATVVSAWTPMSDDSATDPQVVSIAANVPDGAITVAKLSSQAQTELSLTTGLASLQNSVNERVQAAIDIARQAAAAAIGIAGQQTQIINAVRATLNGNSVGVTQSLQAIADLQSGLQAQWTVAIDINNNIRGIVQLFSDEEASLFSVLADRIVFCLPDGTGAKQIITVGLMADGSTGVGIDANNVIIQGTIKAQHLDVVSLGTISITDPANTSTLSLAAMSWLSTDGTRIFDMKNGIFDWSF